MLIASEFMPVSLPTPIATDLTVTEGQAGQAVSVSGIFAVLTGLMVLHRRLMGAAGTVPGTIPFSGHGEERGRGEARVTA